jgi:hypothetical protein
VSPDKRRVALVHDFLVSVRGAERVFRAMCDLWPEADVFTPIYDVKGSEGRFADRTIQTSFLQRLRPNARTFRALLPFYPAAIESLDLSGYDLVLSSSSAWAHAVIPEESATGRFPSAAIRSRAHCCAVSSAAGGSGTGSRPSAWTAT